MTAVDLYEFLDLLLGIAILIGFVVLVFGVGLKGARRRERNR